MTTSIADLIAEVAAEHEPGRLCRNVCSPDKPCHAARLAAALSPENVAAGLRRTHLRVSPNDLRPGEKSAADLLAAITVPG